MWGNYRYRRKLVGESTQVGHVFGAGATDGKMALGNLQLHFVETPPDESFHLLELKVCEIVERRRAQSPACGLQVGRAAVMSRDTQAALRADLKVLAEGREFIRGQSALPEALYAFFGKMG